VRLVEYRSIGAYFENAVRRAIWDILGVNQKIGRLAVRDPRADDGLDMILDIAYLNAITVRDHCAPRLAMFGQDRSHPRMSVRKVH